MRFQNQGLKTGSFAVRHGRTPIVASMLLISHAWDLTVYLLHVNMSCHALCLSNFARPSLPSFFGWSCWFVAQLNKIAQQTAEWRSSLHVLVCVSVQIWGPRIAFWGLIWVQFWSLFRVPFLGTVLGPYNYKKSRAPKRGPKMEPETRTKIGPKSGPQNAIRGPKFVLRRKQGLHDLHSAVCWAIGFNCATN